MSSPRLSIAMTTFNAGSRLAPQLRSFLAQTRLPDELVVCDDASTDGTPAELAQFAHAAPFSVRVLHNERRLGAVRNFEKAMAHCQGDLIFLSDHDDVWLPAKLAVHERAHREQPECGFVFSDGFVVDAEECPLGTTLFRRLAVTPARLAKMRAGRAFEVLVRRPMIHGCTISFAAPLREVLLPIPDGYLHDVWTALCLSVFTRVWPITDPLMHYRLHAAQTVGITDTPKESELSLQGIVEDVIALEAAAHRFEAFSDRVVVDDYARVLRGRLNYLRGRASAPAGRARRLMRVLRTALSGEYLRYAGSVKAEVWWDVRGVLASEPLRGAEPMRETRRRRSGATKSRAIQAQGGVDAGGPT